MSEAPRNDIEDKKAQEKPDAIKKQEDIAQKYPDLNAHEEWVLAGLDIKFDKQKGMTREEINKWMGSRFDSEIAKAGQSGKKQDLLKMKEELSWIIENTPDMKQKIALYEAFIKKVAGEVGTQVAAENQRGKQNARNISKDVKYNEISNSDAFEKKLNRMKEMREEIKKLHNEEGKRQEREQLMELHLATANLAFAFGPPGKEMPKTQNA